MAGLGPRLKKERECRGLSRADVARKTGVYIHFLAALEHDDFASLPDRETTAEFLRVYSEFLGLDEEGEAIAVGQPPAPESARSPVVEPPVAEPPRDEQPEPPTAEPPPDEQAEPSATTVEEHVQEPEVEETAVPVEQPQEPVTSEPEVEPVPAGPAPEHIAPPATPDALDLGAGSRGGQGVVYSVAAVAALVLAILIWWGFRACAAPAAGASPGAVAVAEPSEVLSNGPPSSVEVPSPQRQQQAASRPAPAEVVLTEPDRPEIPTPSDRPADALTVTEAGVGTGVVNRGLVGESDRFPAGSTVHFWTRVRGGARGGKIHHVWSQGGQVIERIELALGGRHWRTHSSKTLYAGSAGRWVVEAHDGDGRVLARREFVCTPPG